jgi:hypothetical protein
LSAVEEAKENYEISLRNDLPESKEKDIYKAWSLHGLAMIYLSK